MIDVCIIHWHFGIDGNFASCNLFKVFKRLDILFQNIIAENFDGIKIHSSATHPIARKINSFSRK